MVAFSAVALFVTLRSLLLLAPASLVEASPVAHPLNGTHGGNSSKPNAAAASSNYWLANIQRQGVVAFGAPGFQIYRNVMDFGAKGKPKPIFNTSTTLTGILQVMVVPMILPPFRMPFPREIAVAKVAILLQSLRRLSTFRQEPMLSAHRSTKITTPK